MDWKQYEREIEAHFRSEYPSAHITANAKRLGKFSKVERQIDVLIEQQVCDLPFPALSLNFFAKFQRGGRLMSRDVEEQFLRDGRGCLCSQGQIIISPPKGYTDAAIQRTNADDADVILDVLNFCELQRYQGFGAFPSLWGNTLWLCLLLSGKGGSTFFATQGRGALVAWLYQQGLTLDEAQRKPESSCT